MNKAFEFLALQCEKDEVSCAIEGLGLIIERQRPSRAFQKQVVKLKRTFNMKAFDGSVIKFWRVVSPVNHPNYQSDLSLEGLKDWKII